MNWLTKAKNFGEKIKKVLKKRPSKEDIENSDWTSCCKGPVLKKDLEDKYNLLKEDYDLLSRKIEEIKNKEKMEERKQIEFSEKIDELNQETDTLLDEIDKWQT